MAAVSRLIELRKLFLGSEVYTSAMWRATAPSIKGVADVFEKPAAWISAEMAFLPGNSSMEPQR